MKKLKNVWLYLSFLLFVAGMASCSTEDPTGVEVSREDIIGTWKVTANDWKDSTGDSGRNDYLRQVLLLKADGTATFLNESFTWTLTKGSINLSDVRGRSIRVVILSYTGDEIKVSYLFSFQKEDVEEDGSFTFQRVEAGRISSSEE